MAEEKYAISTSLNGDIIVYIARNTSGRIIAREPTLEKLQVAIKNYKEPLPIKEEEETKHLPGEQHKHLEGEGEPKKKFLTNKFAEKVQKRKKEQKTAETTASEEPKETGNKKFLESDLKTRVQKRKEQSKKKSFWDRLK